MPDLIWSVGGLVLLVVLLVLLVVSRYKVARPSEAYIVTGRGGRQITSSSGVVSTDLSGQKVVMGGGVFVIPLIQRLHVLDLSSRRIMVTIRNAVSGQGIKLNVDGVAIVKVGGDDASIRAAAQRFLGQQDEIETFTQETLAGSLRSIVGSLTVEQIIRDRAAFAQRVTDESESSLTGQGLVLDTFQIQDISDDGTYLDDLGRPESAKVGRMAAVAEAAARREAEQAQLAAEQEIAITERELVLKKAEIKAETDAAMAQASAAGPLAQADRDQAILGEQEKVAVRRASLKERELDTEVRRPADAARYRVETEAEARRNSEVFEADARRQAAIAAATAQAEAARLNGQGEKDRRIAEADAVRAEGEAKAAAVELVGQAEALAMQKRADAFKQYNEAAVLQMLVEILPEVAKEVAAPLAAIDKLTVVSTEGASSLPKQVNDNVVQTLEMLKNTTGFDLGELLGKYTGKSLPAGESTTE